MAAARNEFSDDLPFIMPLMVPEAPTPELATAYPGFLGVRAGQLDVLANVPWVAGFETDGLTLRDAIHYDALGQIEFGQRIASTYLDLVTPDVPDFDLDGTVGFRDFLILSMNFSQPGSLRMVIRISMASLTSMISCSICRIWAERVAPQQRPQCLNLLRRVGGASPCC